MTLFHEPWDSQQQGVVSCARRVRAGRRHQLRRHLALLCPPVLDD